MATTTKLKVYTFSVRRALHHALPFPLDMLRYDGCHPMSQQCVSRIVSSDRSTADDVICLKATHPTGWHPSFERWRSFGWEVTDVMCEGRRIAA